MGFIMPDTKVTYTANGTANLFTIPFPYLDREHLIISVNGVQATNILFANDYQVQVIPTPSSGQTVRIIRQTPYTTPVSSFVNGGITRAEDLNRNAKQALYVIQEARDRIAVVEGDGIGNSPSGDGPSLPTPDEAFVVPVYDGETWAYFNAPQFKSAFGLTNDYIRVEQQTNFDTSLGNYPTGEVWVKRGLTTIAEDSADIASLDDGGLVLPAGTYRIRAAVYWNIEAHIAVRVKGLANAILSGPVATYSDRSTSNAAILIDTITLGAGNVLTIETAAAGYDETPGSQGIAHGVSSFGPNRFTVVELWKVA